MEIEDNDRHLEHHTSGSDNSHTQAPQMSPTPEKHEGADHNRPLFLFAKELYSGSMTPHNKHAPLYSTRDRVNGPMVRIRALQHMTIIHLRKALASETAKIVKQENAGSAQMEIIRKLLRQYVNALRDLKYMLEPASNDPRVAEFLRDLLYINAKKDATILVDSGIVSESSIEEHLRVHVPDYTGFRGHNDRSDKQKQEMQKFFLRLKMALFGGLVLVVPMLIMSLHPTLLTQLLTTSLFVLFFSIFLAFEWTHAEEKDIIAATAAYAAVLVVFVGASRS